MVAIAIFVHEMSRLKFKSKDLKVGREIGRAGTAEGSVCIIEFSFA